MKPIVELPPVIPFTFQVTALFEVFLSVAVKLLLMPVRSTTLVGEIVSVIAAGGGGGVVLPSDWRACPESGVIMRPETSTTSKSEPWILPRLCKSSLFQRESGAPERYQAEPLSAIIMPYFLSARRMIWLTGE